MKLDTHKDGQKDKFYCFLVSLTVVIEVKNRAGRFSPKKTMSDTSGKEHKRRGETGETAIICALSQIYQSKVLTMKQTKNPTWLDKSTAFVTLGNLIREDLLCRKDGVDQL